MLLGDAGLGTKVETERSTCRRYRVRHLPRWHVDSLPSSCRRPSSIKVRVIEKQGTRLLPRGSVQQLPHHQAYIHNLLGPAH
jgi:hypothetical protein